MKKTALLLFGFIFCIGNFVSAQDTIVLLNGNKLPSKVTEISSKTVKYKDFSNLEGPDYILEVTEISSIIFQNGKIQIFNEIAESDVDYINDVPVRESAPASKKEYGWTQRERAVSDDGRPVRMGQKYAQNKEIYNPRLYIRQYGDPYSPVLAGVASYFLPGLGQMVSGEPGRGAMIMGGTFGCYILAGVGMAMTIEGEIYDYYPQQHPKYNSPVGTNGAFLSILGFVGGISMHVFSIVDAVRVAKVNNMYHQDMRENYVGINIKPFVGTPNAYNYGNDIPVGVTLSVSF